VKFLHDINEILKCTYLQKRNRYTGGQSRSWIPGTLAAAANNVDDVDGGDVIEHVLSSASDKEVPAVSVPLGGGKGGG